MEKHPNETLKIKKQTYADYTHSGSMIVFYVPKYFFSSEKFSQKEGYAPALYFLSSL